MVTKCQCDYLLVESSLPTNFGTTKLSGDGYGFHLPMFNRTMHVFPPRHMERYVERMVFYFTTNQGYWLMWFPTTLEGEAYECHRNHAEGYFRD